MDNTVRNMRRVLDSVTRYTPEINDQYGDVYPDIDGEYVRYNDIAELIAALAENPPERVHDETIVSFTPEMLERLKVAHARAVEVRCDRFIFDGRGYLTDYAKYLIEYLEEQFNGESR